MNPLTVYPSTTVAESTTFTTETIVWGAATLQHIWHLQWHLPVKSFLTNGQNKSEAEEKSD